MKQLKGWETLGDAERRNVAERRSGMLIELGLGPLDLDDRDTREKRSTDSLSVTRSLKCWCVTARRRSVASTRRVARLVPVELSAEEFEVYEDITEYIRHGYNRARANKQLAVGFVMVTYQKMLASSSYAIRQSLRRRSDRLKAELKSAQEERRATLSASALEELAEAEELSASLEEAENAAALHLEALETEILEIDDLVRRLGSVRDSKADELLRALALIFSSR